MDVLIANRNAYHSCSFLDQKLDFQLRIVIIRIIVLIDSFQLEFSCLFVVGARSPKL